MKKLNIKALMVTTLVLASFTAAPIMVAGYDNDNDYNFDQVRTFLKTLPNLKIMPMDRFGIALLRKE